VSLAEDVRAEIRLALRVTGTSQAELARTLGLSTKHVSQVLTGKAALSLDLAEAMLGALGLQMTVRARALMGGRGGRPGGRGMLRTSPGTPLGGIATPAEPPHQPER
jgi:transcriptional regulator with XRE-family HTH domain